MSKFFAIRVPLAMTRLAPLTDFVDEHHFRRLGEATHVNDLAYHALALANCEFLQSAQFRLSEDSFPYRKIAFGYGSRSSQSRLQTNARLPPGPTEFTLVAVMTTDPSTSL